MYEAKIEFELRLKFASEMTIIIIISNQWAFLSDKYLAIAKIYI